MDGFWFALCRPHRSPCNWPTLVWAGLVSFLKPVMRVGHGRGGWWIEGDLQAEARSSLPPNGAPPLALQIDVCTPAFLPDRCWAASTPSLVEVGGGGRQAAAILRGVVILTEEAGDLMHPRAREVKHAVFGLVSCHLIGV